MGADTCLDPSNVDQSICANGTGAGYNYRQQITLWQEIDVVPSSTDPSIAITGFDFKVAGCEDTPTGGSSWTGFVLDDSDFDVFQASRPVSSYRAKSNTLQFPAIPANCNAIGDTLHFELTSPYTVDSTHHATRIVIQSCSENCPKDDIHFAVKDNSYPPPDVSSNPELWSGYFASTCDDANEFPGFCDENGGQYTINTIQKLSNNRDYAIRIYRLGGPP